jgi:hypothetical protein
MHRSRLAIKIPGMFTAHRIGDRPIITQAQFEAIGAGSEGNNINGPSLIRKPDWIHLPGRYWLYFAHHHGRYIRLAVADQLEGPYTLVPGGTLSLEQVFMQDHIASPDVHVDHVNRRIIMFYHGCHRSDPSDRWEQLSSVAFSSDGVGFASNCELLSPSYLRMFQWKARHYGIAMPGIIFKSDDGLTQFEQGPRIVPALARHFATLVWGDVLYLFYSVRGDCPERIVQRAVRLHDDWKQWQVGERYDLLAPERDYEGANTLLAPSVSGWASAPCHQLRDPAIFLEDSRVYMLYTVAGENGIALAELKEV